ncbi:MAG: cell division protein FtsZ [Methanomassiliicoccales archaeon]|nr:cell division protein FtsZ [Methanomassiliicoccales archaeon]
MPNSLVKEALKSVSHEERSPLQDSVNANQGNSADDEEIKRIAAQLDVSVKIIGCGGGGCNTINRCVDADINGAQLCGINTDAKHLLTIRSASRILIGKATTRGLGAGAIPEVGERAAQENDMDIRNFLNGANIVFVTAGMGGGTGTGSAHYVARIAKQQCRALTIGVVTLPFKAEGTIRMENALAGLDRLRRVTDTTIVVPNDKLLELVPKLPIEAAFKVADEVLMQTIKGLTEIITKPGLVNLDYADILTLMNEGGVAFIGMGEASKEHTDDPTKEAVKEAINSPLLGDINVKDSKGALVRVVGGPDMTVTDAQKAAEYVGKSIDPRARIIWGCSIDPASEGMIQVLVILTGAKSKFMVDSMSSDMASRLGIQTGKLGATVGADGERADDGIDFIR